MPCVACREVVVDALCATVHATDYLWGPPSHCASTSATAGGSWPGRRTWPNPNRHSVTKYRPQLCGPLYNCSVTIRSARIEVCHVKLLGQMQKHDSMLADVT